LVQAEHPGERPVFFEKTCLFLTLKASLLADKPSDSTSLRFILLFFQGRLRNNPEIRPAIERAPASLPQAARRQSDFANTLSPHAA
jgi:hypothetical protein